jgi:plastocyanin
LNASKKYIHEPRKEQAMESSKRNSKLRNSKWILCIAASTVLSLAALTVPKSMAADPPTVNVKIDNFSFTPATLTVKAGTQITWTNADDIPHTVVSDSQEFKSKVLDTNETFTFTPSKPGTYSYFCSIHPKMTGKVVVE